MKTQDLITTLIQTELSNAHREIVNFMTFRFNQSAQALLEAASKLETKEGDPKDGN